MIRALVFISFCGWALPALAVELDLPGNPTQTVERISPLDSYGAPIGPFANAVVPSRLIEGRIDRRAWRLSGQGLTTLQILAPMRAQLDAAGFATLFECDTDACGGFDFRFGTEVLPAPNMYVDIRDFRFLTAALGNPEDPDEIVTLMVSRSGSAGYIQIFQSITDRVVTERPSYDSGGVSLQHVAPEPENPASDLLKQGHLVLADLRFEIGSSDLSEGDYPSLATLAQFMADNPGIEIALVGHTDSQGDLNSNIALSKRRATSVMERLAEDYQAPQSRMRAEGMGFLAPVASNLTPEGREQNRRVEVILLTAE